MTEDSRTEAERFVERAGPLWADATHEERRWRGQLVVALAAAIEVDSEVDADFSQARDLDDAHAIDLRFDRALERLREALAALRDRATAPASPGLGSGDTPTA